MPTRTPNPITVKVMLCAQCNNVIAPGTYYMPVPQGGIHEDPCQQPRPLPSVGATRPQPVGATRA